MNYFRNKKAYVLGLFSSDRDFDKWDEFLDRIGVDIVEDLDSDVDLVITSHYYDDLKKIPRSGMKIKVIKLGDIAVSQPAHGGPIKKGQFIYMIFLACLRDLKTAHKLGIEIFTIEDLHLYRKN